MSTVVSANWAIQMEFSGVGNGWTDVTFDVRSEMNVSVSYGIRGVTATDRVAATGTMKFTLNNGPTNSARTVGYYSPDNLSCRTGFNFGIRVRLAMTYTPIGTVYRFLGSLDSVKPSAGVRGRYLSVCSVVDWLDEAARYNVTGLGLALDQRGDQVFDTVVMSMPIQPAAIQTTPGLDTYPFALDNVQDESTTTLQILQSLALSELGYIYMRSDAVQGGTLVYESRSVRGANNVAVQTFSNTMEAVKLERNRQNLSNKVQVTAHPRRVDATNNTVLFTLNTVSAVQAFISLSLNAPFRDPLQPLARVGGTNMQTPTPFVDYTMNTANDGSGTDLTNQFSVTYSLLSANSATLNIQNNSQFVGYITLLQLRGQGIYDYNTTVLTNENTSSELNLGQRVINIDMPYQADPVVANEASQYVLSVWSNPLSYVTALTVVGNWSDALMQAVFLRDISDCVALDETITGMADSTRYFINAVDIDITQGRVFRATFTLAPADQNAYWLLEVVGSGELNVHTRLGFGVIVGHTDVAHADAHQDSAHSDVTFDDEHGDIAHGDIAHADSTHTDTAHSDVAHSDTAHGDTAHTDVAHVDTAFTDTHDDIAHSDAAHGDTAHTDVHNDTAHDDVTHSDVAHVDAHSDVAHADDHTDFTDHGDHDDGIFVDIDAHDDVHNDTAFTDTHNDTAHSDVAFEDDAHSDHTDTVAHSDVAHVDVAHSDDFTDVGHGDVSHSDVGHVDAVHSDVTHSDVAHGDASHSDAAHIDGPAHTDTHVDVSHVDVVHQDAHQDTAHGDLN